MSDHTIVEVLSIAQVRANAMIPYYYLNHSQLSSLAFGSESMRWTGSRAEALKMLERVKSKHAGQYRRFKVLWLAD